MSARRKLALALVGIVVIAGLAAGLTTLLAPGKPPLTPAQEAALQARREEAKDAATAERAESLVALALPKSFGAPEPVTPTSLFKQPLPPRQVIGFVPYWTLSELTAADFADATALCYYGVSFTNSGALLETGPEWRNAATTLGSASFTSFVQAAHAAKTRVLLTLASADNEAIEALIKDPATSGPRVAAELAALVHEHGLDGIDIDIEGTRSQDREGYVRFVKALTTALRKDDPTGQLMLDTYGGSAGTTDFFDVKKLAGLVDSIFVEGYDMNEAGQASATAPLVTTDLGYSEVQTLLQYRLQVPPGKLLLGLPFYGYDFTTRSLARNAALAEATPEAVTYSAVAGVGRKALWDPVSATPFTRFVSDGKRHQTYYDDPISLAIKSALASQFDLLGVGAWAFGMEGGNASMLQALTGGSPVLKLPIVSSS